MPNLLLYRLMLARRQLRKTQQALDAIAPHDISRDELYAIDLLRNNCDTYSLLISRRVLVSLDAQLTTPPPLP